MSDEFKNNELIEAHIKHQIEDLKSLACMSVDPCLVAKAIALANNDVVELLTRKATNPLYKFIAVRCISSAPEIGVVFEFECVGVCLVPPSFLVVVHLRKGVDEIIDPFTGTEFPEHQTAPAAPEFKCSCGGVSAARQCEPQYVCEPACVEMDDFEDSCDDTCGYNYDPCGYNVPQADTLRMSLGRHYYKDGCAYRGCRNCSRRFYVVLRHPGVSSIRRRVEECLEAAAVATAVTAILSKGATSGSLVATFEAALKSCLVARGVSYAFRIRVSIERDPKSCGGCSWSNCSN